MKIAPPRNEELVVPLVTTNMFVAYRMLARESYFTSGSNQTKLIV